MIKFTKFNKNSGKLALASMMLLSDCQKPVEEQSIRKRMGSNSNPINCQQYTIRTFIDTGLPYVHIQKPFRDSFRFLSLNQNRISNVNKHCTIKIIDKNLSRFDVVKDKVSFLNVLLPNLLNFEGKFSGKTIVALMSETALSETITIKQDILNELLAKAKKNNVKRIYILYYFLENPRKINPQTSSLCRQKLFSCIEVKKENAKNVVKSIYFRTT